MFGWSFCSHSPNSDLGLHPEVFVLSSQLLCHLDSVEIPEALHVFDPWLPYALRSHEDLSVLFHAAVSLLLILVPRLDINQLIRPFMLNI